MKDYCIRLCVGSMQIAKAPYYFETTFGSCLGVIVFPEKVSMAGIVYITVPNKKRLLEYCASEACQIEPLRADINIEKLFKDLYLILPGKIQKVEVILIGATKPKKIIPELSSKFDKYYFSRSGCASHLEHWHMLSQENTEATRVALEKLKPEFNFKVIKDLTGRDIRAQKVIFKISEKKLICTPQKF